MSRMNLRDRLVARFRRRRPHLATYRHPCMYDNPLVFRLFPPPYTCSAIPQKILTFKAQSRKAHF